MRINPCIHISGSKTVSQKHGPRPAAREGPPKPNLTNPIKHDRTPLIMARAPEVFYRGSWTVVPLGVPEQGTCVVLVGC